MSEQECRLRGWVDEWWDRQTKGTSEPFRWFWKCQWIHGFLLRMDKVVLIGNGVS